MIFYSDPTLDQTGRHRQALVKAIEQAAEDGSREVIIIQHTLKMAEGPFMEEVLGEGLLEMLLKDREIRLNDLTVHLETPKTRSACQRGVIFAPFIDLKLLAKLKLDDRATAIVWAHWGDEGELEEFRLQNPTATVLI